MTENIVLFSCIVRRKFRWRTRGRKKCWRWYLHLSRRDVCRTWRSTVNPSVNGWSHSGWSGSTCRSRSTTACVCFGPSWAWVWCSAACTRGSTKGKWLSVSHSISPILDEKRWLTWMPLIRMTVSLTQFPSKLPPVIRSMIELEHACQDHIHTLMLLLSCGSYHLQSE